MRQIETEKKLFTGFQKKSLFRRKDKTNFIVSFEIFRGFLHFPRLRFLSLLLRLCIWKLQWGLAKCFWNFGLLLEYLNTFLTSKKWSMEASSQRLTCDESSWGSRIWFFFRFRMFFKDFWKTFRYTSCIRKFWNWIYPGFWRKNFFSFFLSQLWQKSFR